MAEFAFTFKYLYQQVALRIFGTDSPTGDDLTRVKEWVNDGYLRFLSDYDWSFMTPNTTLSVSANSTSTMLPADFEHMEGDFTYSAGSNRGAIKPTTVENILDMRARANITGAPRYYAIDAAEFDETVGQRWQVLFYPIPDSDYTLTYSYRVRPSKLVNDDDYPLGGSVHALTILQAAFMIAEQRVGGAAGAQTEIYEKQMLPRSIAMDRKNKPTSLGVSEIPSVHAQEYHGKFARPRGVVMTE